MSINHSTLDTIITLNIAYKNYFNSAAHIHIYATHKNSLNFFNELQYFIVTTYFSFVWYFVLTITFNSTLFPPPSTARNWKLSFDTAKLNHYRHLHHYSFHDALEKKFSRENPLEWGSTETWSQVKNTIKSTTKAVLGPKNPVSPGLVRRES